MKAAAASPTLQFLKRLAEVFQVLMIDDIHLTGRIHDGDKCRNAIDDRIAYRRAALDDPSAHHRNVVGGGATDNDPAGEVPASWPVQERPAGNRCSCRSPDSGLRSLGPQSRS